MTKPASGASFTFSHPLSAASPDLQHLFDYIAEGAAEREEKRILPYDIVDLIRHSRFGALRIRNADGGAGSSIRELLQNVIALAAADANVAQILRNHFSVVERLVRNPYNDRSRGWRAAVAGGAIIGLATTELGSPKVGNVVHGTKLTRDGDGYRLNGTKYYSTGAIYADYILVRASDAQDKGAALLVPVKREGIELLDDWDGFGQRLTGTGTTHFHNVRVEADEVVFDDEKNGYGAPYTNTFAQLFLTTINAGIIRALLHEARNLVRRRGRNFYYAPSETTTEDPLLQQTVGQISSSAFAAQSTVLAAADALDAESEFRDKNGEHSVELAAKAALAAAQAKIVVDELTIRGASLLFDAGGASATKKSSNLDRHWRNARTLSSHNPVTHKAQAIGNLEINGTPLPAKGFF